MTAAQTRWASNDWPLTLKPGGAAACQTLWTEAEFGDVEFKLDVKPGKDVTDGSAPRLLVRGIAGPGTELKLTGTAPGKRTRVRLQTRGREAVVFAGEKEILRVRWLQRPARSV